MAGNSIGTIFKVTTWGESHGPCIGVVVDGCPSGIKISQKEIQHEVDQRKGKNKSVLSTRNEPDRVEILSGIFEGKTLGTPIALMVRNEDCNEKDYKNLKNIFRPGHADFTYQLKYGIRDHRGGGRSSGRETVARIMAGAIAKKVLSKIPSSKKTKISGRIIEEGETIDEKDSVGAIIEITIKNPPKGLGEPVFDKLDADLAKAFMSIGAVKGIEFGAGFKVAKMKGSENNDQMTKNMKFLSNNAGGILGGISTGEPIVARLAIKPPPSIKKLQKTSNMSGKQQEISIDGRHDKSLAEKIIKVAESMAAITILDHLLR